MSSSTKTSATTTMAGEEKNSKELKRIMWLTIGCILLFVALIIVFLWFLVVTSKPTFTVHELEDVVHCAVNDYDESVTHHSPNYYYQKACQFYDSSIINGGATQQDILESYHVEMKMKLIHQRFRAKYPGRILPEPRWALQNTGGVYCRQLILLCNFKEYLVCWVSGPIAQVGFSGSYGSSVGNGFLNEGDVMISGHMESFDPEQELSAMRPYEFGQTSFLKPGRRRIYSLSKNCAMLSFGLHDGSNMLKTFFPGLIFPYLFQNNDTPSFVIQITDAMKSMWMCIKWRLAVN